MKLLIIAASLALSSAALATPLVGDSATYSFTMTDSAGTSVSGTVSDSLTAFNQATSQYKQTESRTLNGNSDTVENWVDAKSFFTDAQIVQALNNCVPNGGKLEAITVGTTAVNACAYAVNNQAKGTIWLGQVPFGVVKVDLTDAKGKHTQAVLTAFQVGH